ncbi:MAG: sodium:solute symporter family protein [Elusimicrobiaceae bacterium]|nr:sodium:solute symporter family protein [Elusimicrobiaceae bacterium]
MQLSPIDYIIIGIYFFFVLAIGMLLKRKVKSSADFLGGRGGNGSIPLWITSLAFISANLGAQEVLGMAASGAKYGIMTAHFYWVGAIPAMVFLGLFMMPFYYGSRARSVPEYLSLRFDEKTRTFNALSFATMTVFSSGVSLYALAILLEALLGWNFGFSILLSAGIVAVYTFTGGLKSAIYNEVLQFFLIVLGITPLVYAGLHRVGGWTGLKTQLPAVMTHTWQYMGSPDQNPMGVGIFGMVMGLGFVLSFGYWCTDFLLVQRAMTARSMSDAQRTPLIAAFPKMLLPFIVILPGLIALVMTRMNAGFALPVKPDGRMDFDMTLPTMLTYFYPSGLLGVGLTALMASFMSGMAGNVTAFNTVWTYDIYQAHLCKTGTDEHYLKVGRIATVAGIIISIATAYLARSFNNIMDLLQLVFGFVNAPLFATFLLGMFWKRTTGHGAFSGLLAGTAAAAVTHGITIAEGKGGWLLFGGMSPPHQFRSAMGQAFAIAIVAWATCFLITLAVSLFTKPKPDEEMRGLVYSLTQRPVSTEKRWYMRPGPLAAGVLIMTLALNYIFH